MIQSLLVPIPIRECRMRGWNMHQHSSSRLPPLSPQTHFTDSFLSLKHYLVILIEETKLDQIPEHTTHSYIHTYSLKSTTNSPVWGLLRLAPIIFLSLESIISKGYWKWHWSSCSNRPVISGPHIKLDSYTCVCITLSAGPVLHEATWQWQILYHLPHSQPE